VPTPVTTQQAAPGRATWRTIVQGFLSTVLVLGIVLPVVVEILDEELGSFLPGAWLAWLVGAAAFVAALAGALARIMAIPAVDAFLERLRLGSAPEVDTAKRLVESGAAVGTSYIRTAHPLPVDPPAAPDADDFEGLDGR